MRRFLVLVFSVTLFASSACGSATRSTPTPTLAPSPAATPTATLVPPTPTPAAPVLETLTGVAFVSPTQGWVLGGDCQVSGQTNCAILATSDGGSTWNQQYRGPYALEQIVFVDASHGWVLGRKASGCTGVTSACPSVILATADGKTWKEQPGDNTALSELQFESAAEGWALATACPSGAAGARCTIELRKTTDGGATWSPVPVPGLMPTSSSFVDPLHGWAVGWSCANATASSNCRVGIYVTRDGGKNWFRQYQTEAPFSTVSPKVAFSDLNNGWWLAGGPAGCTMGGCWPELYHTSNGGRYYGLDQHASAWKMTGEVAGAGFPQTLRFANATAGWIAIGAGAGPGVGGVVMTMDGGKTWARVGGDQGWDMTGLAAVGSKQVWAVGSQRSAAGSSPLLVHSADGGITWVKVLPKP